MNSHAKGSFIVLGPEEGESLWQPLPSRGYVTNKLNPYTSPYDLFSTGIQVLEPGARCSASRTRAQPRDSVLLPRGRLRGDRRQETRGSRRDNDSHRARTAAHGRQHRFGADAAFVVHQSTRP